MGAPRERDSPVVVAVDVGGTDLKGGLFSRRGEPIYTEDRPTGRRAGPASVLDGIVGFVAELVMRAGPAVQGIGLAVPGVVNEREGLGVWSANLGWRDAPVGRLVRGATGLPVSVGHDVRLAGLAELLQGAARGCRDYLFVSLGTGVGGAVFLGGKPYAGAHGTGGELGHTTVAPDGPQCSCGKQGCVESMASARAIETDYERRTGRRAEARAVAAGAAGGDPVAGEVWGRAVTALGVGIANYVKVLDPERVVVGGGLAGAGDRLFEPLQSAIEKELLPHQAMPSVVRAELGRQAGCRGAALQAWLALEPGEPG